jgi:hypothetical protein
LLFEMFVITFVPLIFTSHKSYMLLILLFSTMCLILYVMKHFVSKPEKSDDLLIIWFLLFFFVLSLVYCVHSVLAVQPADTWGMKLGHNVKNIRARGAYSEHRAKLEELGFVFKKNKKVVEIEWNNPSRWVLFYL